jgi:hypothetical protein
MNKRGDRSPIQAAERGGRSLKGRVSPGAEVTVIGLIGEEANKPARK